MKVVFNLVLTLVLCLTVVSVAMPVMASTDLQGEITAELSGLGEAGGYDTSADADLSATIGNVIRIVLGFLGVVMVVIVVYAGFLWMTAGGNEDQVKKAKQWMTNAIIGLVIMLAAYAITDFVITKVFEATAG